MPINFLLKFGIQGTKKSYIHNIFIYQIDGDRNLFII